MRALWTLGLLVAGCGDGQESGEPARVPTLVAQEEGLPRRAPGVLLLVELGADGYATVEGSVASEQWVDLDAPEDDTWAFRYQVLDANDGLLYERTLPGPTQVRDFLQYYSDETGYDILAVFPLLGRFPLLVPELDGAERVRLQLRAEDGSFTNVGSYDLVNAAADDQGTSERVVGWETLWDSGPAENRLDVVLVNDGYTEDQLADWEEDAARIAEELLAKEPFAGLSGYVNVHRVDAVSAESGASYDCVEVCEARDTAFGTVFPLNWVNTLLGTDYDTRSVFQLQQWEVARAVAVVPWDVVLVVSNTEKEGGMSVHYATATTGLSALGQTSIHELGHALGQLGDEYMGDACIQGDRLPANVTDDPQSPPWLGWVEEQTPLPTPETRQYADVVGAFEGAMSCRDLYRPMLTCLMEDSAEGEFCLPCAEQLTSRVLAFADPVDGLSWSQGEDGADFSFDAPQSVDIEVWIGEELVASGDSAQTLRVGSEALAGRAGEALRVIARVPAAAVLDQDGVVSEAWTFSLQ